MGLSDGTNRSLRAQMNDLINQAGGYEEILEWAILKMQEELEHSRQALSSATVRQNRTQQQYDEALAEAEKWERRVQLALAKGRSDLAIEALPRQNTNQEMVRRLKFQLDQLTVQVKNLKKNLTALESKIAKVRTNRDHIKSSIADVNVNEPLPTTDVEIILLKENPEKILEEAISETQQAIANAITDWERLQQQHKQAEEETNHWHQQAQIALQKDDDNLAFQALISKTVQGKITTALKTQLVRQVAILELLKQNLIALENVKDKLEAQVSAEIDHEWDDDLLVIDADICIPSPD
ncbi:PspA/IM30 family protein [Coleofasciculus sp. FACHB-1120]|uniref:PspA/IM30 family protein n=1 Tax=Coleofasciculus sp. FACHB-1120 TaxID=2692783 RepID=UPI001683BB33|nr:PspA/IM30 family protein [Coleofasciculus sp. FACHB-1120]MBD2744232.1 PspA/IM30 family protein [Coleofasciculus sp. FACHB-1120]